jgi:NitT/TauT family transport system ATP-binding protein
MATGASISFKDVSIELSGQTIVSNIDLSIDAGEFVCLLGPSGCGKSTLLNAIAGFIPVQGSLLTGGKPVRGPGHDRGVVFQNSEALFPWLTAFENVEYGPRIRGVREAERREKCRYYLNLVGLGHAADKFPAELSGGMRQRLQIARVLVNEPSVILMDEPFGALDAQTREVMQYEIDRIWRATRSTIVFITHDINESILIADRVITMTTGPRAHIKTIVPIDLPRPRDETDSDFVAIYRKLRSDIDAEVSKVLRQQGLHNAKEHAG